MASLGISSPVLDNNKGGAGGGARKRRVLLPRPFRPRQGLFVGSCGPTFWRASGLSGLLGLRLGSRPALRNGAAVARRSSLDLATPAPGEVGGRALLTGLRETAGLE